VFAGVEGVHVNVVPAHGLLEHHVDLVERGVGRDRHPPPHRRVGPVAKDFDVPLVKRYFPVFFCAAVAIAFPVVYLGFLEFNDPDGEYTGFGINLMMSMLFVAMLLRRDSPAGQSMYIRSPQ